MKMSTLLTEIHIKTLQVNIKIIFVKVENISKGRLDSIPSSTPSVKIQILGGKVFLMYKAKHCWVL